MQWILLADAIPWPSAQPLLEAVKSVASSWPPSGQGLNGKCGSLKIGYSFSTKTLHDTFTAMIRHLVGADALKNVARNKALIGAAVFTAFASILSAGSAMADETDGTTCALVNSATVLVSGDKTISNIICDGNAKNNPLVKIDFGSNGLLYEFSGNFIEGGTGPGSAGSISYAINITQPDTFFQRVRLTSAGTDYVATKSVLDGRNNLLFTLGQNAAESFVSPVSGPSFKDFATTQFFTALNIVDTWASGTQFDASVEDVNNIFTQKEAGGPSEVPGPLPILGAAAAFGLSRRLRARMKRSAPAV